MQRYQFDKIFSVMENEFGKICKGKEYVFEESLMVLETNLLKIHRQYPSSDSRRLREAVALTLFTIRENYSGEEFNTDNFRNENNERLEQALLTAFDPFSNMLIWKGRKKAGKKEKNVGTERRKKDVAKRMFRTDEVLAVLNGTFGERF